MILITAKNDAYRDRHISLCSFFFVRAQHGLVCYAADIIQIIGI